MWGWDGSADTLRTALGHVDAYVQATWQFPAIVLPLFDAIVDADAYDPCMRALQSAVEARLADVSRVAYHNYASKWLTNTVLAVTEHFNALARTSVDPRM